MNLTSSTVTEFFFYSIPLRSYPNRHKELDLITGIAPIFRIDLITNEVKLIGTGFWVTDAGHLVTAWHVVDENIDEDGIDVGPIFAVQTFPDRSVAVRVFKSSDKHPLFDLALSETVTAPPQTNKPTTPIHLSLDDLSVGDSVFSFAVLAVSQIFENEKVPGHTVYRFQSEVSGDYLTRPTSLEFAVRLSFGSISEIFEQMRDRVMLPFPCIQSDVPIYGGNSGGPLLDLRGRICAVHCTSFGGNDIAFHVPILGVLNLQTRAQSLGIEDAAKPYRTIAQLALLQKVSFDPPMLDATTPVRSLLRWLAYIVKCLIRVKRASMTTNFGIVK
jgi:hypothetical protein